MSDSPTTEPGKDSDGNEHSERWRALVLQAYDRFHQELKRSRSLFPGLTEYSPVDRIDRTPGTIAWHWGVESEVRETINHINGWGGRLYEWSIWNIVINTVDSDHDKWEILDHFIEPIAFFCMMQPSGFVDRLMITCENLLHQASQYIWPDKPDRLDQDALPPGQRLNRDARKKQLGRLGERWLAYNDFKQALNELDSKKYRSETRNFRNLTAHSFAPRLMMGHISPAIRSIVPRKELVEQADGSFSQVEHPTRTSVEYSMSDAAPLPLDVALSANLFEYQRARTAMTTFAALVAEVCDRTDQVPDRSSPSSP